MGDKVSDSVINGNYVKYDIVKIMLSLMIELCVLYTYVLFNIIITQHKASCLLFGPPLFSSCFSCTHFCATCICKKTETRKHLRIKTTPYLHVTCSKTVESRG